MTYFADLTPYSYIPDKDDGLLLNVGWLDENHEYIKGATSPGFIEKLVWLCTNSAVKRTPGIHTCSLCPPMKFGFHVVRLKNEQYMLGSAEIRVQGLDAAYACPDLILHYVMKHEYLPPDDFVDGVLMIEETGIPCDQWSLFRGPHWGGMGKS